MNIVIEGIEPLCKKHITEELETEMWYTTLYIDGEMECVVLDENVILKVWEDEAMIDFGSRKTFFYRDDFKEIRIQ